MKTRGAEFTPKYERVRECLLWEIARTGKKGAALESQRQLMARFDASFATIRTVLDELKERGVIEARQGKAITIRKTPRLKDLKPARAAIFLRDPAQGNFDTILGQYMLGANRAAERLPCELLFHYLEADAENNLDAIVAKGADGALFLEDDSLYGLIEAAMARDLPFAVVHPTRKIWDFCADIDDASGIREAVLALGAERAGDILFAAVEPNEGHNREKLEAFKAALTESGRGFEARRIVRLERFRDLADNIDIARRALRDNPGAESLLIVDPNRLPILESAIRLEGLDAPGRLNIVTFGNYGDARRSGTRLRGTIHVPHVEAAETALEILVERVKDFSPNARPNPIIRRLKTRYNPARA